MRNGAFSITVSAFNLFTLRSTMNDYVEVFVANDVAHAYLVKSLLENAEVTTLVENEFLEGALGGIPLGGSVSPRILVPQADLEKARDCIKRFESQSAEDGDESEEA